MISIKMSSREYITCTLVSGRNKEIDMLYTYKSYNQIDMSHYIYKAWVKIISFLCNLVYLINYSNIIAIYMLQQ